MKKIISSLASAFVLMSVFLVMPPQTHAGDCNAAVEDVTDYTIKINTDVFFRKTIQGAPEDNCAESQVIGSFSAGQVLWVAGQIETGVVVNEATKETGNWLYIKHPKTGDYGFVWSAYAEKIATPQGEEGHVEDVIKGEQAPQPVTPVQDEKCTKITDVTDYFIKTTDELNVRNGVCNGIVLSTLEKDTVLKVIGKIGEWFYVETPKGSKGFVHSDYTEVTTTPEGRVGEAEVTITDADKAFVGPDPLPAPGDASTLKDIVGHPYETAIRYLQTNGIVEGYPDGLFKADIPINRAEFTKIVVQAKLKSEPFSSAADCFPDVAKTAWYSSYVCYAKDSGIVSGFPDNTFKPGDNIKFVEAVKILANTFGLEVGDEPKTDVWYQVYVEAMQKNNYIPLTIKKLDQLVNRGEMSEMLWRILQKVTNKSSAQFDLASGQTTNPTVDESNLLALCTDKNLPTSVDMKKVRASWLEWNNATRKEVSAPAVALHDGLNYASSVWAQSNKTDGAISHTRKDGQSVSDWFKSLGITFKTLSGFVYAENIGVQSYTCNDTDCTDEVTTAAKSIYDAFVKEKGTASTTHYDNVVEPDFKELGLGIALDEVNHKLYLTTHYAQAIESYPATCQ